MHAIFLHLARRHLGDTEFAEEGHEVQAQSTTVALDPTGAALPLGDDLVFLQELFAGLLEGLFRDQETGAALAHEGEIPVLGDLLSQDEAVLFGAGFSLLTANAGRALPKPAVLPAIDLELTAYQFMRGHARMGAEVNL